MKRLFAIGLGLLVAVAATLALSFWLRPFWYFERLGKAALGGAGLKRAEIRAPRGRLVHWAGGSGPTVVLLHGANDQAGAWGRIAKPLARAHRLVVPDLPGHGESEPSAGPLAVGDLLTGVESLLRAETGRVTLVGNSLGGFLAMLCAFRHPDRVAHVVLLNGAAIHSTPGAAISLLPRTRDEARRAVEALMAPASPRVPDFVLDDMVRRAPGSPLARLMRSSPDPTLSLDGRLGELATPVSLVWGEADRLMPVAYARTVEAQLPAAGLQTLPACGHVPQRECPERAAAAIERALQEPPRPASAIPEPEAE